MSAEPVVVGPARTYSDMDLNRMLAQSARQVLTGARDIEAVADLLGPALTQENYDANRLVQGSGNSGLVVGQAAEGLPKISQDQYDFYKTALSRLNSALDILYGSTRGQGLVAFLNVLSRLDQ